MGENRVRRQRPAAARRVRQGRRAYQGLADAV